MHTNDIKRMLLNARSFLQKRHFQDALSCLLDAYRAESDNADIAFSIGNTYRAMHEYEQALHYYYQAIDLRSEFFAAYCNLGAALREVGRYEEARTALEKAIALQPVSVEAHGNLGLLLCDMGIQEKALDHFKTAVSLQPQSLTLIMSYADAYLAFSDITGAQSVITEGIQKNGISPLLLCGLGKCAIALHDLSAAKEYYHHALRLDPHYVEAHVQLGNIMREWNRPQEAISCYMNALRFQEDRIDALVNLGETYQLLGETARSEEYFHKALTFDNRCRLAHHNLLVSMNYSCAHTPEAIFSAHLEWGKRFLPVPHFSHRSIDHVPDRRLRIGYLSPDFCNHPAAAFLEPMLRYHSREQFEVYCYVQTVHVDEQTQLLASFAKHWKTIERLNDEAVAQCIRHDKIDILVNTAGHFSGNRLEVFAKKPAPLQISGIGYPGSTGLKAIDYRLSDRIIDPSETSRLTIETPLILENGFCCYSLPRSLPAIGPLPGHTHRYTTFGSLHTTARLNHATIALWSAVLHAVPSSRLIICRNTLVPSVTSRLRTWFSENGIAVSRIEFCADIPASGHFTVYNGIDITLDTIPWSGHTTACESLAMGVPVITLCGTGHAGRTVSSVLTFSQMPELVATTKNEFIAKAKLYAEDIDRLASLRSLLRSKINSSPLCDGREYMRILEQKLQSIWMDWCASQ